MKINHRVSEHTEKNGEEQQKITIERGWVIADRGECPVGVTRMRDEWVVSGGGDAGERLHRSMISI